MLYDDQTLYISCMHVYREKLELKTHVDYPKPTLLDVNIFGLSTIWVLLFLICSLLSLVFLGYFYCICMLHIVFNNDILQRVLRSVTKNGIALTIQEEET